MKSIRFLMVLSTALFVLALISSCEEEAEFTAEESDTYTTDGNVESAFVLVDNITNTGMTYVEENGMGRIAAISSEFECAVLTYSGTKSSGRLEVDFGDGCTAADGRVWKGKIVLEYTGRRYVEGSIVFTIFNEFYIDGYKVEGTIKSTTVSASLSEAVFNVEVVAGKLTWPDESFATWNAERTHTWSISQSGLVLAVDGIANGVNALGTVYQTEITQPLIFKSECVPTSSYVAIQGKKSIKVGENLDILFDYGSGACDRLVSITIGRLTKDVNF